MLAAWGQGTDVVMWHWRYIYCLLIKYVTYYNKFGIKISLRVLGTNISLSLERPIVGKVTILFLMLMAFSKLHLGLELF